MLKETLRCIECDELPDTPDPSVVYRLHPRDPDDTYYNERVDRNIGWITKDEQALLKRAVVGIAGNGGMGGLLAQALLRVGVGAIKIGDSETFDVSNINRQFGATRKTIGVSKAFATTRMLRNITDDTTLIVYPQGITETTVGDFVEDCNVICDEIEFWAIGSRILLHQEARRRGVSLFNCNTVGFGTHLFLFTPNGFTMESCLNCDYESAKEMQEKVQNKRATGEEVRFVMERVLRGLVPELAGYSAKGTSYNDLPAVLTRLFGEGKAPIIGTNPVMATGFLADHVLFCLLRDSGVKRELVRPPAAPGYLYFDAGKLLAKSVERKGV